MGCRLHRIEPERFEAGLGLGLGTTKATALAFFPSIAIIIVEVHRGTALFAADIARVALLLMLLCCDSNAILGVYLNATERDARAVALTVPLVDPRAQLIHVRVVAENEPIYLSYDLLVDLRVEEAVDERDGEALECAAYDLKVEAYELELDGELAAHKRLPHAERDVVDTEQGQQDESRLGELLVAVLLGVGEAVLAQLAL